MKGLDFEFENPWCWKPELVFARIILESLQFLVCFFRPDSRWWSVPSWVINLEGEAIFNILVEAQRTGRCRNLVQHGQGHLPAAQRRLIRAPWSQNRHLDAGDDKCPTISPGLHQAVAFVYLSELYLLGSPSADA